MASGGKIMKTLAVSLGAVALLAGCNSNNEKQQVENTIRAQLSAEGTVTRVSMTKQGDGSYSGNAGVRMADGHEAQLNCTARLDNSSYTGTCGQVIDQQLVDQLKGMIRQQLAARGLTVTEVEMARQDDNTIAGHAVVRDPAGNEVRTNCTAPRDAATGRFALRCVEAQGAAAPASQAAEPAAPAEGDQGPAEEGVQ